MARIVLTTIGSLGDLHPYLAVARALAARGHHPVLATHALYAGRAQAAGIEFAPVRPDIAELGPPGEVMRQAMDARTGSDFVLRTLVLPHLRAAHADLLEACHGAHAVVGHVLTFAAPVVARQLDLPRIHTILQPFSMFSAHDPPVSPAAPWTPWVRRLGAPVWGPLWSLARLVSRPWFREVDALRAAAGEPRGGPHPLFDGFSSSLNLALFPGVLASPQPDWPANTVVTGAPIYDRDESGAGMPRELERFLDAGPPPLVFTLGSSGVWDPGTFYTAAIDTTRRLGARAVLLTGPPEGNRPTPSTDVLAVEYAPHSELFPRAAAIVHQGGIGTTAQALRAGRPTLVVPFSHDQPDNASRLERLGVSRTLGRSQVSAARMTAALEAVLADPAMARRAATVGEAVRRERGAEHAAEAIEMALCHGPGVMPPRGGEGLRHGPGVRV